MSTVVTQLCRNGASKMKFSWNGAIAKQLFRHESRSLSYLNGNILLNSGKQACCNVYCNENCHCYHTSHHRSSSSSMMNSNKNSNCNNNNSNVNVKNNSLNYNQFRFNSTQQQNNTTNEEDTEQQNQNTQENESEEDSDNANELEARNEELEGKVDYYKDLAARAQADLLNHAEMSKKDTERARKFAVKKFSKDILNVADALRGAVDAIETQNLELDEKSKPLVDGVKLTQRTLLESFSKNGITLMDCEGQEFDPNFHEALFQVPSHEVAENTIVNVVTQGYLLHEQVLRSAKVGISVKPVEALEPDGDDSAETNENETQENK